MEKQLGAVALSELCFLLLGLLLFVVITGVKCCLNVHFIAASRQTPDVQRPQTLLLLEHGMHTVNKVLA